MSFGQTPKDGGGIPLSSVIAPGTSTPIALQGSTNTTTDANSNTSTPVNTNLTQIASVTQILDNTNIPRASIYGKATNPGDTSFLLDSSGRPLIDLRRIGGINVQMGGSDGVTAGNVLEVLWGLYNGSTIDQMRGNQDNITLLASAAITSNSQSADQTNYNARGVKVFIKTGSFGASESTMVVNVQVKDPVNGTYYTVLSSPAAGLSASSTYILTVYPGITVTANVSASDVISRTWRVSWSASNWGTGGSTLGISCAYIL